MKNCDNCAKRANCGLMPATTKLMEYCVYWESDRAYMETSVSSEEKGALTCSDIPESSGNGA